MTKDRKLDRDQLDFGNGKIGAIFRALFFPTLVGMIFNSALTVIDGIFVGRGVGADGIAAVNIVAPLFTLTFGIGLMFGVGASVVASIRLGVNNTKAARIIMTQAFLASSLLIGIILCIAAFFPCATIYALGCNEHLEANALAYLLPLLPGLFFLLFECVGMMLIRLDGSPKYAMYCQAIPAAINIVLDYIMVFPMGMGVAGAAWATSISCILSGTMTMVYFLFFADKLKFYRLKMSVTSLLLTLRNVGYMVKIGFATFLTEGAMGIMIFTGNYTFMKMLGEDGVAAYSIACYLFPVIFSIANAVAQSAQPIISFNYGCRNGERVGKALRLSTLAAGLCGIIVMSGLCIFADSIVGAFLSSDEAAYNIAQKGLPYFATCAVFFALNITFIGYYQSIEFARLSTYYTLLRGIIFLVPAFFLMPLLLEEKGLWLAIPTSELLTLIVIIIALEQKRLDT